MLVKFFGFSTGYWRDDYRRLVPGRSSAYNALPDRLFPGFEVANHGFFRVLLCLGHLPTFD